MARLSRRKFISSSIAASAFAGCGAGWTLRAACAAQQNAPKSSIHQQILELAAQQEQERRTAFAAVNDRESLGWLQGSLREKFLRLIGGLPQAAGPPQGTTTGRIEAADYTIEKLVYESLPGYYVPALLYKPRHISGRVPGVLSPCGHSAVGKADGTYQTLHINLAQRGYAVLTYDPVGQGERSQFWDAARQRSRFDLACGEHAVLGNPLYLWGESLARYRIWDGIRGLDYLASLAEVDPQRLGCVGNSGGGTLTAYISALDARVKVAAIGCYITTLPRRMANRTQEDPSADPEQDIFGFVSEGIDHAGLLALRAPRPTLVCSALLDFFPIEGARETVAEAKRLFEVAGAGERIEQATSPQRHGLSLPLRQATYRFFDRWLAERDAPMSADEFPVKPRTAKELMVCIDGQVNVTFQSRPLLLLAVEAFRRQPRAPRKPLRELPCLDSDQAAPLISDISTGAKSDAPTVVLINGNETGDWRDEKQLLGALTGGHQVVVVDPRGAGRQRIGLSVSGHEYTDPLAGVEENVAYNAFLVGKSLLGMRVADVLAAIDLLAAKSKPARIVLCGRRDAALVACLTAALTPAVVGVAVEELLLSFWPLFEAEGRPINAASILPGLLGSFGDVADVLAEKPQQRVLIAAGVGKLAGKVASVSLIEERFTAKPQRLTDWLAATTAAGRSAR